MKYGIYEDRRLEAAALARGEGVRSANYGIGASYGAGIGERRREDYVKPTTTKRSFFDRARDYLGSYGTLAGKIGFLSMFPIGFAAGFGGTFLYDTGKFVYDSALYLMNNFPNYSASELFSRVVNYFSAAPVDSLVSGIKDGVVAGLGGTVFARWIKRKLFGE